MILVSGAISFACSALVSDLSAAAPFYGIPSESMVSFSNKPILIPTQAHFGTKDDKEGKKENVS